MISVNEEHNSEHKKSFPQHDMKGFFLIKNFDESFEKHQVHRLNESYFHL